MEELDSSKNALPQLLRPQTEQESLKQLQEAIILETGRQQRTAL